jgi:hypothetical protein
MVPTISDKASKEGFYSFLLTSRKKQIRDMEFGIRLAMADHREGYDLAKGLRDLKKDLYWRVHNGQMVSYSHLSGWVADGYEIVSGEAYHD